MQHERELIAQVRQLVVAQIHVIEQNFSGRRIVKPGEQIHQRGLARAGRAGNAQARAGRDGKRNVAQNRPLCLVGERNVAEGQRARRAHQRAGVRAFDHIGRFVEQRKGSFRAGEMGLHAGHLFANGPQRRVQLRHIAHHQQQIATGQRARLDRAEANEDDRGRSHGGNQRHDNAEAAFE